MEQIIFTVMLLLLLQLLWIIYNSRGFAWLPRTTEAVPKKLSVLIPARNEEINLQVLLNSLTKQTQQPFEIIILDDHSTDKTKQVIERFMQQLPKLQYIKGNDLPAAWTGKNFACHQLAVQAAGDWLLFLDADIILEADALEQLIRSNTQQYRMISGFPRQVTKTWLEKMLVPMMLFVIYCHLPIRQVMHSANPAFAAAHGAFIFIHRNSYFKAGGHQQNKASLIDDVALMKRMKSCGFQTALIKAENLACMRMYHNTKEVWQGFAKNVFSGTGSNTILFILLICWYSCLYVLPFILLLVPTAAPITALAWISFWLGFVTKAFIDILSKGKWYHACFFPLAYTCLILLALYAMGTHYFKRGYEWKGRRYYS